MSKKDWKKQLLRMKQLADQNLGRSEKSEVLTDDLQLLERQVNQIKDAWQSVIKRLQACLIPHTGEVEKRLRKLAEYAFANCLSDMAMTFNNETILGKTFGLCGDAQLHLAKYLVQYSMDVEAKIIQPAQNLLDKDIPTILKLRRQLANMTLDMDSAKSRYQALCKQTQSAATSVRLDTAREELDTAEAKVEHCKDVFATEMYSFFSREEELCGMLLMLMESQSVYHRQSLDALDRLIPVVRDEIELTATRPVFGFSLEEHLRTSKREIASVIEDCVLAIMRKGLDVEGIFRIAPAASKVKKLKAAFDANMVDTDEYDNDIHCFCGALKHYLRELPQPLMTLELYNEWMQASQRPPDQRLNAIWVIVDKLPKHNYNNLRYLIKFLAKVAEHSELNKMNASNLAIVIGPNLLWPPGENRNDMHSTGCLTLIVETLIGSSEWFFPGDIDFPSSNGSPSSSLVLSSSETALQKSQAKAAFMAGNQENSGPGILSTSSSAGNLPDQAVGPEASVSLNETVSYGTLKPPRKIKKAAPAPPVPLGSHHQRSASATILTSTIQELALSSVSRQDDTLDRKVATMTRPRVPPPARPPGPAQEKTTAPPPPAFDDKPVMSLSSSAKMGQEEASHSLNEVYDNTDAENKMLGIPTNFVKKPVSRSLDDVVLESRLGDKYRSVSGSPCLELETVSDTEEVFSHHQASSPGTRHLQGSDLPSDLDLASATGLSHKDMSKLENRYGLEEQAAVECLENLLCDFEPPESSHFTSEHVNQRSALSNKPTASTESSPDRDAISYGKSSVKSTIAEQEGRMLGKGSSIAGFTERGNEEVESYLQPCQGDKVGNLEVSVEPPTPEVSGLQYFEVLAKGDPPYIDDEGEEHDDLLVRVRNKAVEEQQHEAYSNTIDEVSSSSHSRVSPTNNLVHFDSKEFITKGVDGHEFCSKGENIKDNEDNVNFDRSRYDARFMIDNDKAEVGAKTDRNTGILDDTVTGDRGISKDENRPGNTDTAAKSRCEVSVMAYKDRHEVSMADKDMSSSGVIGKEAYSFGVTEERDRPEVHVVPFKDRNKRKEINLDNQNTLSEDHLGKGDGSPGNSDKAKIKSEDSNLNWEARQGNVQDAYKTAVNNVSTTSFVSSSSITGVNSSSTTSSSTTFSNSASSSITSSAAVSQVKPSEHSEMVQSLKLFFLSDKAPPSPGRSRSNSDVNTFRPTTLTKSSQPSTESISSENSALMGSVNSLAMGRDLNANSSTMSSAAARFRSSTDISDRTVAAFDRQNNFSAVGDPSVPVIPLHCTEETHAGTVRSLRPGLPPPPPARRNRPSDSNSASTTTRAAGEQSSKVIEDTHL